VAQLGCRQVDLALSDFHADFEPQERETDSRKQLIE
jgi:hypothetical protein